MSAPNAKQIPLIAAYLQKPFVRCIHCRNIVESDGEVVSQHTTLSHKVQRGETAAICRVCYNNFKIRFLYIGENTAWIEGRTKTVEQ